MPSTCWRPGPIVLAAFPLACAVGPPGAQGPEGLSGDDAGAGSAWSTDDGTLGDETASPATSAPAVDSMASPLEDAPSDAPAPEGEGPGVDAPPDGACAASLAPGDLVIDELLIESVAGAGDYGEWLEVRSTLACAIDLRGLHGECPSGAKVRTFDVTDDVWLPPTGIFVVADSVDPAVDHDLPGTVIPWSGQPGDVLRNKGGTISLRVQDALIDSVTYPALKLVVGASVAFPADCPLDRRSDWTVWQTSIDSWFPGFRGSPNAPNLDVSCP
jgi:hypothetical protein